LDEELTEIGASLDEEPLATEPDAEDPAEEN
jgi:hypothetical protein